MNDDQISAARPVTGVQDLSRSQRMKRIHQEISLMRGMQPKILPFATCWNRLKQQKPELFQDMDDDNPPPTSLATTG